MFSREFLQNLKKPYFAEHLRTAASESYYYLLPNCRQIHVHFFLYLLQHLMLSTFRMSFLGVFHWFLETFPLIKQFFISVVSLLLSSFPEKVAPEYDPNINSSKQSKFSRTKVNLSMQKFYINHNKSSSKNNENAKACQTKHFFRKTKHSINKKFAPK